MNDLFPKTDPNIGTMAVEESFDSNNDDIRTVLGMDTDDDQQDDVEPSQTQLEDEEVSFHDNENEFEFKRRIHEVLTIVMCCLFLFSTRYYSIYTHTSAH